MPSYFADTSFWIALIDRQDVHHAAAIEWSSKVRGGIITTRAVLLETANALSRPAWRSKAIALIDHILGRSDVEIVRLDDLLWQRAWSLYHDRLDKAWSLTDCISFVVMQERKLTEALTADSHFRQAGFHPLLLTE
jgi:uncharacterized protein